MADFRDFGCYTKLFYRVEYNTHKFVWKLKTSKTHIKSRSLCWLEPLMYKSICTYVCVYEYALQLPHLRIRLWIWCHFDIIYRANSFIFAFARHSLYSFVGNGWVRLNNVYRIIFGYANGQAIHEMCNTLTWCCEWLNYGRSNVSYANVCHLNYYF